MPVCLSVCRRGVSAAAGVPGSQQSRAAPGSYLLVEGLYRLPCGSVPAGAAAPELGATLDAPVERLWIIHPSRPHGPLEPWANGHTRQDSNC